MIDTGAGVIDADYRGKVFVLLFNFSESDFESKSIWLDRAHVT
jgi:dUTP pyrophosphatase